MSDKLEPKPKGALEIYHPDGVGSRGMYKQKGENSKPADAIIEGLAGGMAPGRFVRGLQAISKFAEFSKFTEFFSDLFGWDNITISTVKPGQVEQSANKENVETIKYGVLEINNVVIHPSGADKYRFYDTIVPKNGELNFQRKSR